MNIRPTDFVLEVGSGHDPKQYANVLCDRYVDDDTQRGGEIWLDGRPLVAADAQALPFADQSFDYVICSHVLEHVEDPEKLARELQRVAPRGYIETPSEIAERLYGWPYHHWLVNLVNGKLILRAKDIRDQFGQLFHSLAAQDRDFANFHNRHPNLFLVQYEWDGEIEMEIHPSGETVIDLESRDVIEAIMQQAASQGWFQWFKLSVKNAVPAGWRVRLKSQMAQRRQPPIRSLEEIVVCPACRSDVCWDTEHIRCSGCQRVYPIRNGVPRLLIEESNQSDD